MQGFIGRPNNPVVCLQNAATIRRTLPIGAQGEVSISNIETMMPPEEGLSLTIMEVLTSDLKLALENGVSALNTGLGEVPDGRFLHVGAMQVSPKLVSIFFLFIYAFFEIENKKTIPEILDSHAVQLQPDRRPILLQPLR